MSGPYVHELPKWIRKHPLKMALNIFLTLGLIVSLSVLRDYHLAGMLVGLCISGFVFQFLQPWMNWVYSWGVSGRETPRTEAKQIRKMEYDLEGLEDIMCDG